MMRKYFILILLMTVLAGFSFGQANLKIYNPEADAVADVENAIKKAKEENKHVLIMLGGNWCPWCIRLHHFIWDDTEIDSTLTANYVWLDVNYSKENKNKELLERFEFPQRFGFPVIIILDQEGKRLHTQNSAYLEEGKSYDRKKVLGFLRDWNVDALEPENYK